MSERNDINIDELLAEIRKDKESSFDEIYNKAKSRIDTGAPKDKTDITPVEEKETVSEADTGENAEDVMEEAVTEEAVADGSGEEAVAEEEPDGEDEAEEITPEEDTEDPEEDKKIRSAFDDALFEEMFRVDLNEGEAHDEKTESDDKTRVFDKLRNVEAITSSEHTKVSGQTEATEDELRLEEECKENRKGRIKNFRLFTENLTDSTVYSDEEQADSNAADMVKPKKGEDIFSAVEKLKKPKRENTKKTELLKKRNSKVYEKIDVGRVKLELKTAADKNKSRFITMLVTTVLLGIAEVIKAVYTGGRLPALAPVMTEQSYVFYLIAAALSIPVIGVCTDMFIGRLKKSEGFSPNNELFLLVLCVCNMFHTVMQLVFREEITASTHFFTLALSVIVLISVLADKQENTMIMRNLETITKNEKILGIYSLGRDTDKLAAGISNSKEPNILCASEVEVPDSFMDSSTIKDKQNGFMKFAVPCMLVLSVICAVIAKMTYGTWIAFSTAFASAALLTAPAFISFVLINLISNANISLNRSGCEILGYEAVEYIDNTDAIVLDTAEIFNGEISRFHIINSRSPIDTVHAFEIVCAVILQSEGVLKKEVEGFIKEQQLNVPEVESLEYEEKLGLSCWVEDRRVLLGTRQMMIEHNLEVPPEYLEAAYKNEGKKVFYLAVDSMVIAMFCAEYFIGRMTKKQLEKIYNTGIILMLMTTDPHIDEVFVSNSIGVDVSSVKTVNWAGMETIKKSIDRTAKQKRTGLIYKRNVTGLLRVINTAFRLYDVQSLSMLIQAISIGFAFAISAVLNIVATSFFVSHIMIIAYHLLWTMLCLLMTRRNN
ncbi:MAG: hypothetical protein E7558_04845 [Ruminococcaceae bacterium]|nr:hypothetical protein [Oscillospiraceae bacterium]